MSTKGFVWFLAMAFAVGALSLSALFQPTFIEPLIERINEPVIAQLEAKSAEPDRSDCTDCGESPGPGHDPDEGVEPGPGVSVEVDPAVDASGFIGTVWDDDRRVVVVYTPGGAERAASLAQGVYYEVDYLRLRPWEWTDRA